jgi:hypothetical protein
MLAGELVKQRQMRRDEIAFWRIVPAAQLLEARKRLAVHLQSEHEGQVARA